MRRITVKTTTRCAVDADEQHSYPCESSEPQARVRPERLRAGEGFTRPYSRPGPALGWDDASRVLGGAGIKG